MRRGHDAPLLPDPLLPSPAAGGRRGVLLAALGACLATGGAARAQPAGTMPGSLRYDPRSRGVAPIPPAEQALQTVTAATWFKVSAEAMAIEGPAFDRQGNLFFCDASGGRVLRLTPGRALATFLTLDLNPGGLALHRDGRIAIAALDIPQGTGAVLELRPDGTGLRSLGCRLNQVSQKQAVATSVMAERKFLARRS
jgi:lactonase